MLKPNIETKGRLMRGGSALLMAVAGVWMWPHSRIASIGFAMAAVFLAFEAARGWCAFRACGVKTPY